MSNKIDSIHFIVINLVCKVVDFVCQLYGSRNQVQVYKKMLLAVLYMSIYFYMFLQHKSGQSRPQRPNNLALFSTYPYLFAPRTQHLINRHTYFYMNFGRFLLLQAARLLWQPARALPLLPENEGELSRMNVDSMGISVPADCQREYSFTDKKAAFWYGMTHTDNWDNWHAGLEHSQAPTAERLYHRVDGDTSVEA